MIILGVILLILGFIFGIYALWIAGIIIACIGAALWIFGSTRRPIGGRRYWY